MSHTLFISDLHLTAHHCERNDGTENFLRFIEQIAPKAEALYILGDLFEYWAGDDDLHDAFNHRVVLALKSLSDTRVYLMHGNRDLLMGEALAKACGAELLADPTLIELYGTPTLLSHGDMLCTDDVEYQQFRKRVRAAEFRSDFLSKPLATRKAYIEALRRSSDTEKKGKSNAIMDVNEDALASLFRQYNYPRLIHGHTHRPARHEHLVDGKLCERWVLGDWDKRANALCCDSSGIRFLPG